MKFKLWFESSEPTLSFERLPHGRILIRYLWPGYRHNDRYNPHKWEDLPEQFGSLLLEPITDLPEYLFAQEAQIDPDFQRRGWGEMMYRYALNVAKEHGYHGIASDRKGRSAEANGLWQKIKTGEFGDFDLLEPK